MSSNDITTKIASMSPESLLVNMQTWLKEPRSQERPDFVGWLEDLTKNDLGIMSPEEFATLRVALFWVARQKTKKPFGNICQLMTHKSFNEHVSMTDWTIVNLHRILGSIAGPNDTNKLADLACNDDLPIEINEQALLAIHFMWVEKKLLDQDVIELYRKIINKKLAGGRLKERMALALVLNSAVVGGQALRKEITALLDSGKLGDNSAMAAQAIQSIFMDSKRFREIYVKQHKGFFDNPEDEIPHIHEPVIEEMPEMPSKGKTIVRDTPKIGRNDPCPCGSGKKYKKCCGKNA
ncbi:MAG: DUF1186 domain-containing protein [Victivallales bacterium]|nr:DUF1186 domain-containing protein [Victivallales bacterium]